MTWIVGIIFSDGSFYQHNYNFGFKQDLADSLNYPLLEFLFGILFQQDGGMSYDARMNITCVQEQFGKNWIGTWGPIQWPVRFPNLVSSGFLP
jgi:hypothetical protein